ncbi:MAG: hypothetical protein E3J72_21040 [Planctomycetota bacterium]|nr:MAG: hypothetical protein E3J72_21040 [Planctomycetota bacterium]
MSWGQKIRHIFGVILAALVMVSPALGGPPPPPPPPPEGIIPYSLALGLAITVFIIVVLVILFIQSVRLKKRSQANAS